MVFFLISVKWKKKWLLFLSDITISLEKNEFLKSKKIAIKNKLKIILNY